MSKAFVKDDAPVEEIVADRRVLTDGGANYMTLAGYEAFKAEADALMAARSSLVQAASAEKEIQLRALDLRLNIVRSAVDSAQVIDPTQQTGDRVLFGATVTVLLENGEERVYQIVGIDEANVAAGKVSWISPIGKVLLQARVGDAVLLQTSSKSEELEIAKIEFI